MRPAIVRIHVVAVEVDEGKEVKQESFGSGAILTADGYVVTNHHVAARAKWLTVTLADKEEVDATLVGTDPLADIAVIKLAPRTTPYPTLRWGDSSKLRVGDPVLAVGSPLAFSQSFTSGIVSNTELILSEASTGGGRMALDGEDVGSFVRWIAHDARILHGNSGGPLVNLAGEIIGVNEIEVGLSGAIPSLVAQSVVEQLIKTGQVTRASIGAALQPRLKSSNATTGALVGSLHPGSPAAKAGLKPGDLLLKIGETALDIKVPEDVPLTNQLIAALPLGAPLPVTFLRDGQEQKAQLTPTVRQPATAESVVIRDWGLTAVPILPDDLPNLQLTSTEGVYIEDVQAGSAAAEAKPPLAAGDVILSVAGKPVKSLTELQRLTEALPKSASGTPLLVQVRREGAQVLSLVTVGRATEEDTSAAVPRSWLPVGLQPLPRALAEALKLPAGTKGVRITQLYPGNAEVAQKLKVGDIVTKIDGLPTEAEEPEGMDQVQSLIRQYKVGTLAKLSVLRDGKPLSVSVTMTRAPRQEREEARHADPRFGVSLRSVTFQDRLRQPGIAEGAVVLEVTPGSWAALARLRQGDVILRVAGAPVKDLATARAAFDTAAAAKARFLPLFVQRGADTVFVEVQTDWSLPAGRKE